MYLLQSSVEDKYLKELQNPVTNKITKPISDIFDYLFDTYGDVSPQELKMLTTQVESINLPPNEPVDTLFAEIDDLATIAELAKAPMSERQKIYMGYLLLQKIQVYTTSLSKWDQKNANEQTRENFKLYFREAQKALQQTGSLTINEIINHADITNLVQEGVKLAMKEKESPNTSTTTEYITQHEASENLVTSNVTIQTLQQQIDLMQQMMTTMQNHQQSKQSSKKRNPNQTKYRWTHGICNHTGYQYRTPADGHVKEVTVYNRMVGSVKNVKQL